MTDTTPPPLGPDQPLTSIGEIGVSHTSVWLPTGQHPVRGSTWIVTDIHYATMIPASSPETFAQVAQRVNWVRGVAAAA